MGPRLPLGGACWGGGGIEKSDPWGGGRGNSGGTPGRAPNGELTPGEVSESTDESRLGELYECSENTLV